MGQPIFIRMPLPATEGSMATLDLRVGIGHNVQVMRGSVAAGAEERGKISCG